MSPQFFASCFFFFFNDTATTEIYTLSLHDALPIWCDLNQLLTNHRPIRRTPARCRSEEHTSELQSPYVISYAVFCLKKTTKIHNMTSQTAHTHSCVPSWDVAWT